MQTTLTVKKNLQGYSHYEISLQKLNQVPTKNRREKSPWASGRGEGKRTNYEIYQSTLFNQAYPQKKLVNQILNCWGFIRV